MTEVRYVTPEEVEDHAGSDLAELLDRTDGFVWVDVPQCDGAAAELLRDGFGFHPRAVEECMERTHVPMVHAYPRELFVVLHAPLMADTRHVHLLQLNQFIGQRYLVTVHGPFGEGVPAEAGLRETAAVLDRIVQHRFQPSSPMELAYAIVSGVTRRMEQFVTARARDVALLERTVAQAKTDDPRRLVEDMFQLRHQLLTIQTMANQSRDVFSRAKTLSPRFLPTASHAWVEDLLDQFDRVRSLADGENLFLQGVIDLYQTRTATELNLFAKQLTSLGAILVMTTLIAGIYGMNFEHMPELGWKYGYLYAVGLMAVLSIFLAVVFRRKRWL
jgi:magnesium/cobalt transport protein CorA